MPKKKKEKKKNNKHRSGNLVGSICHKRISLSLYKEMFDVDRKECFVALKEKFGSDSWKDNSEIKE